MLLNTSILMSASHVPFHRRRLQMACVQITIGAAQEEEW